METNESDESSANEASGFSGFGGHLLAMPESGEVAAALGPDGPDLVTTLLSLGIEDAEQVVAVAAIPAVRPELQRVLGLQDKPFQDFLDKVQRIIPKASAVALSSPSPKNLGLGVRAPTPEMMAAAEASAVEFDAGEAVELPSSVNLISYFAAVRNQGPRGTCVSFALTALHEYIVRRGGIVRDYSEQHLYYEIKLIDGASGSCGTLQAKGVPVLLVRGQCRESVWPYRNALPCNNHGPVPAAARADGLLNRLRTLPVPPRNVLAFKTQLSLQRPVTLSFPVYNSWYQSASTRQTGRITMRIGNEPAIGGHAVCLVGYVDTPSSPGGGYFIVRNSWGTANFGSTNPFGAGYGTIPYQYITNDGWEAYTSVLPTASADDADEDAIPEEKTGSSMVTIDIGPNVKITIKDN
jgi:hypothetical protein